MRPRQISIVLVLFALLASSLVAETVVDISGQVRVRSYLDKRSFDPDSPTYDYNHLRARLAIAAVVDSNTTAFIQVQDSRDFEDDSLVGALSGTRANTKNLDAHQAYLKVNRLFVDGIGLKAGRFEVKFGNERLFGADDWDNVGLAFNGAMLSFDRQNYRFRAFGLAGPMERRFPSGYTSIIWGGALELLRQKSEVLYYYENIDYNYPYDSTRLDRHTISLYGSQSLLGCNMEWNLAYQFGGKKTERGAIAIPRSDISAHLISVTVTRDLSWFEGSHIKLGVDYASGDDPSTDYDREGFTAPFASQRTFGGQMGYFESDRRELSFEGSSGLVDAFLGMNSKVASKWTIDMTAHRFVMPYAHEYFMWDYIPGPMRVSDEIGWELDFVMSTTAVKGLQLQGGLSVFFAHEAFTWLRDFDPGYYAYTQMTVDF